MDNVDKNHNFTKIATYPDSGYGENIRAEERQCEEECWGVVLVNGVMVGDGVDQCTCHHHQ